MTLDDAKEENKDKNDPSQNSHCHKNQIEEQVAEINAMQVKLEKAEVESKQLGRMLSTKNLTHVITQVVSCLQLKVKHARKKLNKKKSAGKKGFMGKPFLREAQAI